MKKIMFFGGSGRVGSLIVPFFTDDWEVHVFDVRPPQVQGVAYHEGDITDREAVRAATQGMDAVVYMVMVPESVLNDIALSYDLNLKGLHLVLEAARDFNVEHVIYCSTGSVYDGRFKMGEAFTDDMPPRSRALYGMTKALGEQVCEWFCEHFEMTVFVLRLYRPVSYERWQELHSGEATKRSNDICTLDRDLARAMRLSIESPLRGCRIMSICGDWRRRKLDCVRAREWLGWEPTPWPAVAACDD